MCCNYIHLNLWAVAVSLCCCSCCWPTVKIIHKLWQHQDDMFSPIHWASLCHPSVLIPLPCLPACLPDCPSDKRLRGSTATTRQADRVTATIPYHPQLPSATEYQRIHFQREMDLAQFSVVHQHVGQLVVSREEGLQNGTEALVGY